MMNRLFTLLLALLLSSTIHAQQQYRWVKGGGSTCNMSLSRDWDKVTNMCTDGNRNVYAIAMVGGQGISADTFSLATRHYGSGRCNNPSTLLASYNCNGQMRWAKYFDTYGTMTGLDIKYDNAGSIYVVGWSDAGYIKYYTDTAVTNINYSNYIIKYDTSGKLKWMRYLGANNSANQFQPVTVASVAIDGQGNPHYIAKCRSGLELTSTLTTQAGTYDIKYSSAGTLQSAIRLSIDSNWQVQKVLITPSGRLYATLLYNVFGSYTGALIAFSPNGALIWKDTSGYGGAFRFYI